MQLAADYTVAAGTAHRAMEKLAADGLIVVSRGRRAIVAAGPPGTATGAEIPVDGGQTGHGGAKPISDASGPEPVS